MSSTSKTIGVVVVVLSGALILGAVCGSGGFGPRPGTTQDGDCDEGDKRESTPDPDCHGVWYGTPTPGAKPKTTAPVTKPKTPAAKPKTTRR